MTLWGIAKPSGSGNNPEVMGAYNFSSNWTLPWDYDLLCDGNAQCESDMKKVSWFLAPHWDTENYELAAQSIVLESTHTWDGKNLGFAEGAVLTIERIAEQYRS